MAKLKKEEPIQPKTLSIEEMTRQTDQAKYHELIEKESTEHTDQIALMAISELMNMRKLKTISRLKFEQILPLTKLYLFASYYKIPIAKQLADLISQLQISVNGLSRKEYVQMVQQRFGDISELMNQSKKTSKDIFR